MLVVSFALALFARSHLDPRPYYYYFTIADFTTSIIWLTPALLVIMAALGLYRKNIFMSRSRMPEVGRLFLASILNISAIITYGYFADNDIFPVRVVAILAAGLCFVSLLLERTIIRFIARQVFRRDYGTRRVIIVGNSSNTDYLSNYIHSFPESGYHLAGIVANRKYISKELKKYQYSSLKEALKKARPDVIFQTDEKNTEYVYKQAVNRHLLYYFVPSENALSSHFGDFELIGNTPTVLVKTTPLSGGMAAIKRTFDILISLIGIILAAIPMLIVWLVIKISDPKHSAMYTDLRLTRYNKKFKCYKFRSMKSEYSGMTAEEAFTKMGKANLIKKYREDGDYIKNDPRITKFGHFIRRTSLDELPQLFNIFKGDISFIGPRALLPNELRTYGDRSLILTVKSGLTGFAQVSGRRNISFEERRALDIYYVLNWSLLLDFQICLKTVIAVLRGEGAK
jgi:exopolysaccharide biosynthesis polyprenyl glycosylphosphotransferase